MYMYMYLYMYVLCLKSRCIETDFEQFLLDLLCFCNQFLA